MTLTIPTIHLNGTSKERLIEELCGAHACRGGRPGRFKATIRKAPWLS
jgi:hypothetical protein